jgi:2-keto-4-pentenoate hydratase/2-oxohepta-3-ene-1,7-dioic acid hydratase in catechol pathway
MRFVTYRHPDTGHDRAGVLHGEFVHGLPQGTALIDLLGDDGDRLHSTGEMALREPSEVAALTDVQLRAPLPKPPTIRDFYAFEQHVRTARQRRGLEMIPEWYEFPVFYFSNPYATIGPDDDVPIPPDCTEMDYELEVAAVVGRAGSDLDPATAEQHIVGYTVMNDWSARDVQRREMKLSMGPVKGKDFATSLGPVLVTADEIEPYRKAKAFDLQMVARVNGEEWSRASVSDIYWSFGEMLAWASRATRVEPGDVIGSGTCGTGCILELSLVHGNERYPWLKPGDVVELEVEHLGVLRNTVRAGSRGKPLR